jgi:hypothetical protein
VTVLDLPAVVQILQVSIAPVVLISGVGLIILSQTNRMAHVTGRVRQLVQEWEKERDPRVRRQIDLLYQRARTLRVYIACLVGCILADAAVILDVFLSRLLGLDTAVFAVLLFVLALVLLVAGLIAFLVDVNQNLRALQIEIE